VKKFSFSQPQYCIICTIYLFLPYHYGIKIFFCYRWVICNADRWLSGYL